MSAPPEPPDLDGWLVYCRSCEAERFANRHEERDVGTGEAYLEWTCSECYSVLLTLTRANPAERGKRDPNTTLS